MSGPPREPPGYAALTFPTTPAPTPSISSPSHVSTVHSAAGPRARKLALPSAPRSPFAVNSLPPVHVPVPPSSPVLLAANAHTTPNPPPAHKPTSSSVPTSTSTARNVGGMLPAQASPSPPQHRPQTSFPSISLLYAPLANIDPRLVAMGSPRRSVPTTTAGQPPVVHRKTSKTDRHIGNALQVAGIRAIASPDESAPYPTATSTPSAQDASHMYPSPAASRLPSTSSGSSPMAASGSHTHEPRSTLKRRADDEAGSDYKRIRFAPEKAPKPCAPSRRKKNPASRGRTAQANNTPHESTSKAVKTVDRAAVQTSGASTGAAARAAGNAVYTHGTPALPTPGRSNEPYTGPSQASSGARKRKREDAKVSDSLIRVKEEPVTPTLKKAKTVHNPVLNVPTRPKNQHCAIKLEAPRPQRLPSPTPPPPAQEIIEISTDTIPMPEPPVEELVPFQMNPEDSFSPLRETARSPCPPGIDLFHELFEEKAQGPDGSVTHTVGRERNFCASEGSGGGSVQYSESTSISVRRPGAAGYGGGRYPAPVRKRQGHVQHRKIGLSNLTQAQKNAVGDQILDALQSPEKFTAAFDAAFASSSSRPAITGVPLDTTRAQADYSYSYLTPHNIYPGHQKPQTLASGDQSGYETACDAPGPSTSGTHRVHHDHLPPPFAHHRSYYSSASAQAGPSTYYGTYDDGAGLYARPLSLVPPSYGHSTQLSDYTQAGASTYGAQPGGNELYPDPHPVAHSEYYSDPSAYAQPEAGPSTYYGPENYGGVQSESPSDHHPPRAYWSHPQTGPPVNNYGEFYPEPPPLDHYDNPMSPAFGSRELPFESLVQNAYGADSEQLVRHYASHVRRAPDGQKTYNYSTAIMPPGYLREPQAAPPMPPFNFLEESATHTPSLPPGTIQPLSGDLEETMLRVLGSPPRPIRLDLLDPGLP